MSKIGRPPFTTDKREARVMIYLTQNDADYLLRLAQDMGFKGRSEMITAILERLIIGGFSVVVWLKLGMQFLKRREERDCLGTELYFGVRPLPALPVEDEPTPEEIRATLEAIDRENETKLVC